jgi:hypothetical protein
MGLLYSIAKWSVNKLIKQGVDLTDIVETDNYTKKIRNAAISLNEKLVSLQDEFALKRVEIIELQNELIEIIEPTVMTLLAETNENTIKITMTNIWYNKMTIINKAIDEHELLVDDFKKTHEQLQKLESKL